MYHKKGILDDSYFSLPEGQPHPQGQAHVILYQVCIFCEGKWCFFPSFQVGVSTFTLDCELQAYLTYPSPKGHDWVDDFPAFPGIFERSLEG